MNCDLQSSPVPVNMPIRVQEVAGPQLGFLSALSKRTDAGAPFWANSRNRGTLLHT